MMISTSIRPSSTSTNSTSSSSPAQKLSIITCSQTLSQNSTNMNNNCFSSHSNSNNNMATPAPLSPPSTPVNGPSSLHALSRFIAAVIHQLLNRLPTGNPAAQGSFACLDYEKQVKDIFHTIQAADRGGGITGPAIITALALIHRIVESREIDTLSAVMHRERNVHLPNCAECVKVMHSKYPKAWDIYRPAFESRYPPMSLEESRWMQKLKTRDSVRHICVAHDPFVALAPGSEAVLFSVAMMVAHKSIEDWAYHAKGWAKFTGINKACLVKLEKEFLSIIRYDVYMSMEFFKEWVGYVSKLAHAWQCVLFTDKSVWMYPPQSIQQTNKSMKKSVRSVEE